jgi:reductive dehalogenase
MEIKVVSIIIFSILSILSIAIIASTFILVKEGEYRAAVRLGLISLLSLCLTPILGLFEYGGKSILCGLLLTIVLIGFYLFLKKPVSIRNSVRDQPKRDVDEIDTIFARMKLVPNSTVWNNYYQKHPYEAEQDSKARKLPGLLSDKSLFYNPLTFSSADSNFQIIEYLHEAIKHPVNKDLKEVSQEKLTHYIKKWVLHLGAHSIGITELKDYHLYTKRGRGENIGKPVDIKHKYAFVFTVEMDEKNVQSAPASSIVFESSQQYLNSATIALQVATFLKNLGYDSRAHIDGDYELICPLVARDAGLGEIGRMGLLMTPKLGPRVRIAVVTTNAPLKCSESNVDPTMIEFCKLCRKCAECCPGKAIPMDDMKEIRGAKRWRINSESCYQYWCTSGTDCGRCISVCPFSHPNNILHNTIRHLIRRSIFVARFAFIADDLLYGRKPRPKKLPSWMSIN